jgi:hypothetical protein
MMTFAAMVVLLLWGVGSIVVAFRGKRASMVFLASAGLSLPALIFFTWRDGPMDSAGIGQAIGAGLYGLILHSGLRLYRKWKDSSKRKGQEGSKQTDNPGGNQ